MCPRGWPAALRAQSGQVSAEHVAAAVADGAGGEEDLVLVEAAVRRVQRRVHGTAEGPPQLERKEELVPQALLRVPHVPPHLPHQRLNLRRRGHCASWRGLRPVSSRVAAPAPFYCVALVWHSPSIS